MNWFDNLKRIAIFFTNKLRFSLKTHSNFRLMLRSKRHSASSESSLEEGELDDEEYSLPNTKTTSDSMRSVSKNASLWRNVALEQSLNDEMQFGGMGNGFQRGSESYTLPKDESFSEEEPEEDPKNPFKVGLL